MKTKKRAGTTKDAHRIRAIIFDFDDTLEDFAAAHRYTFSRLSKILFERYSIYGPSFVKVLSDVDYRYTHLGISKEPKYFDRHLWARDIFNKFGIKAGRKDIELFVSTYWKLISEGAEQMPHAASVIRDLKKRYKLALMSDSDGEKRIKVARIRKVGLMKPFSAVITSDDSRQNKPSRKMYDMIFKKLGVKPAECAMVGDKPIVDLQLAKKLGMKTVWMKHGRWAGLAKGRKFSFVDHEITDLRQLLRIF